MPSHQMQAAAASSKHTQVRQESNTESTRAASTLPITANVPAEAALFVRNILHLDLDVASDWPGVTDHTFRASVDVHNGQKDRVRAAEWVLYRLFEIWDPRETKLKLRPYFPSLEPLQSIKLRAALLLWLTQLKTSGVLGRQCMIRKSMLDDCRGDKFEEVLFHFSTAVLQRKFKTKKGGPLAQRFGSKENPSVDIQQVPALIYAHHSCIRMAVHAREEEKLQLSLLEEILKEKQSTLAESQTAARQELDMQERAMRSAGMIPGEVAKEVYDRLDGEHNRNAWTTVIVGGDVEEDRDRHIEAGFDAVWNEFRSGEDVPFQAPPPGSLTALGERLHLQTARLEKLRRFQLEVSKRNEVFLVAHSPLKTPHKSPQKSYPQHKLQHSRNPSTVKTGELSARSAGRRLQDVQESPTVLRSLARFEREETVNDNSPCTIRKGPSMRRSRSQSPRKGAFNEIRKTAGTLINRPKSSASAVIEEVPAQLGMEVDILSRTVMATPQASFSPSCVNIHDKIEAKTQALPTTHETLSQRTARSLALMHEQHKAPAKTGEDRRKGHRYSKSVQERRPVNPFDSDPSHPGTKTYRRILHSPMPSPHSEHSLIEPVMEYAIDNSPPALSPELELEVSPGAHMVLLEESPCVSTPPDAEVTAISTLLQSVNLESDGCHAENQASATDTLNISIKADTYEARPHSTFIANEVMPISPAPALAPVPALAPAPQKMFSGQADVQSIFQTRNRLRRSPPGSPAPW